MLARRLIVLLLIICFTPASVLAAMPLTFCLGANGHQAIEYTANVEHSGSEFGLDPLITGGAEQLAEMSGVVGNRDCVDLALLSETRTAGQVAYIAEARLPVDLPTCLLPRKLDPEASVRVDISPVALSPYSDGSGPQLVALRTIILRI